MRKEKKLRWNRSRRGMAAAVVSVVGAMALGSPSAFSDAEPGVVDATVEIAGASEISKAAARSERTGELSTVEDEFLLEQARSGNTVDATTVESASVDDATMVWEDGVQIERLETSEVVVDGEEVGTEVAQVAIPDPAHIEETASLDGSGLGSDAITKMSGGSLNGGYCTTTTVSEQKLTQCFERYKIKNDNNSSRDYFYYGRWATAEGEKNWGPLPDWTPVKIDIRSRPWKGKRSNFAALINYWPKGGNSSCSSGGDISVGFKGFSGSMPIRNCNETNPVVDATAISMGSVFDQGAYFSGRVRSSDFAMIVSTFQGKPAPMGDYGYAKFCKHSYGTCEGVLRKEAW